MRASRTLIAVAASVPLLLTGAVASAHLNLVSPPPRLKGETGNTQLKTKPCGQTTNKRTTDKVTTFTPGQQVDIKIQEYIDHPGYFAVAFDPDGDDSFPFPRADMDKVVAATDDPKGMFPIGATVLGLRTDKDKNCYGESSTHECTIPITIPNTPCENCTLQVTQFMYDKLNNKMDDEVYYQCADIKIEGTAAGGSGGTGSGGAGGAGTGGSGGGTAAGSAGASTSTTAGTGPGTGGVSAGGTSATTGGMPVTAGSVSTAPTAGSTANAPATGGSAAVTNPSTPAADDSSGCGVAKRTQGGASALLALGLLFALGRRRRTR